MAAGILASRLIGLVRQRMVAHYLGTGIAADALSAAFRIGNVTQNLLGEGALSASFVPVYARLRQQEPSRASRFARAALGVLLGLVTLLTVLGVMFAPLLAGWVAAGFDADRRALTAELLRWLFPMTGVLVVGAWALGILTAHRRFLLPYLAPVLWSACQIAALALAAQQVNVEPAALARAVTYGALAGAALQLLVMLVPLRRLLGSIFPTVDHRAEGVHEALSKLPSAVMGRGVIQLSGLVDTMLVTFLGAGANAVFAYAQTLYLLPMSVLGTGEAAAALPELAEQGAATEQAKQRARESLGRSLSRVLGLGIPAAVVLGVLGKELTDLLLRTGQFDQEAATRVALVLAAYATGLPANAASRVLGAACFALGDTARPARYATARVVLSTLVSLALMGPFGVPGVVLGAVVAAWLELVLLARLVRNNLGGWGIEQVPVLRIVGVATATGAVGVLVRIVIGDLGLPPWLAASAVLGIAFMAFALSFSALGLGTLRQLLRRS